MSPTIFFWKNYRFFFFSREEARPHVHICCPDGEAKVWIDPSVESGQNHGLSAEQLNEVRKVVEERRDEILAAWREHFGR